MSSKNNRAMRFNVKIHYHDKPEETKTMLTGELYKFITEFNRTNKIGWIVLSKVGQSTITAQNESLGSRELYGMSNPKVTKADAGKEQEAGDVWQQLLWDIQTIGVSECKSKYTLYKQNK